MNKRLSVSRRDFLRLAGVSAAGILLAGCAPAQVAPTPTPCSDSGAPCALGDGTSEVYTQNLPLVESAPGSEPTSVEAETQPSAAQSPDNYLAVAHGADPAAITKAAIAALGGMERFVKQGAQVVIKPNICTDYHTFEYASTTNPLVVGALVSLCLSTGAKRVRVMDYPFGGAPESAYQISGIAEAVEAAGGEMHVMSPAKWQEYDIPEGVSLNKGVFYKEVMEADVLINVPIAKHHSAARLTLGAKNLMGIVEDRGAIHMNLHERIADLLSRVRPALTVVDAVRILMDHGPTGGDLNDVKQTDTIIASHDTVAADAYAATLFGMSGEDIPYIANGARRGLGTMDLSSVKIAEISV